MDKCKIGALMLGVPLVAMVAFAIYAIGFLPFLVCTGILAWVLGLGVWFAYAIMFMIDGC